MEFGHPLIIPAEVKWLGVGRILDYPPGEGEGEVPKDIRREDGFPNRLDHDARFDHASFIRVPVPILGASHLWGLGG